jgi:hypothetical protein
MSVDLSGSARRDGDEERREREVAGAAEEMNAAIRSPTARRRPGNSR